MSSSCRSESSCEISGPLGLKEEEEKKSSGLSPTTKTRLANLFNRLPKLGRKESDQETTGGRRKDKVSPSCSVTANTSSCSAGQPSVSSVR